jgi:hypothetical protein
LSLASLTICNPAPLFSFTDTTPLLAKICKNYSSPAARKQTSLNFISDAQNDQLPSFLKEIGAGKAINQIEKQYGRGPAFFSEGVMSVLEEEFSDKEASPIRKWLLSLSSHMTIGEVVGLLIKRIPTYWCIAGAHAVADGARLAEPTVDHILNTSSPDEYAHPNMDGFSLNEYQSARLLKAILQNAQVPSDVLKNVHEKMVQMGSAACEELGLSDQGILEHLQKHPSDQILPP